MADRNPEHYLSKTSAILLIANDVGAYKELTQSLVNHGYEVILAENPDEAISQLEHLKGLVNWQAVIADYVLPMLATVEDVFAVMSCRELMVPRYIILSDFLSTEPILTAAQERWGAYSINPEHSPVSKILEILQSEPRFGKFNQPKCEELKVCAASNKGN